MADISFTLDGFLNCGKMSMVPNVTMNGGICTLPYLCGGANETEVVDCRLRSAVDYIPSYDIICKSVQSKPVY